MAKQAFDQIKAGLEDAIAYAQGNRSRGKVKKISLQPMDIHAARAKLNLTQEQFAAAFDVPVATLRKWEQGDRSPTGPAQVLLSVIQEFPEKINWAKRLTQAPSKAKRNAVIRKAIKDAKARLANSDGRLGPWEEDELRNAQHALEQGRERLAIVCVDKAFEVHLLSDHDYDSGYTYTRRPDLIAKLKAWRQASS